MENVCYRVSTLDISIVFFYGELRRIAEILQYLETCPFLVCFAPRC